MGALLTFLQRNSIVIGDSLPLVHSTSSINLKRILANKMISSSKECSVFNEQLNYFFVGRPGFKTEIGREAKYWELPCCFVLDLQIQSAKRIYPFDSGAFLKKPSKYPSFMSILDIDYFEVSGDARAAEKIIGTFFTSRGRYFLLDPRTETDFTRRFSIEATDEEIRAIYDLIQSKSGSADDRRLAIEVQYDHSIAVTKENLLAVVIPETYLTSSAIMRTIEVELEAQPISYPEFPMKKEYHYYAIYSAVQQFYREKKLI